MTVRPALPPRLVIATHNAGKAREIEDLLRPFRVEAVGAAALGLSEPEETGETFEANAVLKARAAAEASGLPALADDSGLAVPALGGAPGVRSARWGGPGRDFALAMARLERELGGGPDRRASFHCALALARPGGGVRVFEGRVDGRLRFPPRGANGFGYDPCFAPDGDDRTFGEMTPAEKAAFNHRARAFARMTAAADRRA